MKKTKPKRIFPKDKPNLKLKGVREGLLLSRFELYARSGIAESTIKFIELGYIQNPYGTTKQALLKALIKSGAKGLKMEDIF